VGEVAGTVLGDRILAFDETSGLLRAEAGLSLYTLNWIFLPRGWFVPVTPGTQFVTLGGMVAADVHGGNHHVAGCIGEHVTALRLRLADDTIVDVSPTQDPELFWASIGGMGLTGHILEVEFKMDRIDSPWIEAETERAPNIDAFMDLLERSAKEWTITKGWIDCLARGPAMGRGIMFRGRWATPDKARREPPTPRRRLVVPFEFPSFALNRLSVWGFNTLMYGKHPRRVVARLEHPEDFIYPLDKILHWNRIYGRRGFTQYQCVIPRAAGRDGVRRFLEVLTSRGGASFLAVIKDCGPQGRGLLSFPMEGTSVALDLPLRGDSQALIDALNEATLREGGRIYLAKDLLTRAEHFRAMDDRIAAFMAVRRRVDPALRIRSLQSVRIFGDPT
jgi:FAD/FMN-containing dehydrogenase